MNLSEMIYSHAQALPEDLQREALDFIEYLEQRRGRRVTPMTTEAFLERFAGCLGGDFPDDVGEEDWGTDVPREELP